MTMTEFYSARANRRAEAWLAHIAEHANDDGVWYSSRISRAGLPDADMMSDANRYRFLGRMVTDGKLERISKGRYKVLHDG